MNFLQKIAMIQYKFAIPWLIIVIIITGVMLAGAQKISIESDMAKEMPQHLPIYQLNDHVSETFGGEDTILLIIKLNENNSDQDRIKDIRDPKIAKYLVELQTKLKEETLIEEVISIANYYEQVPQINQETINHIENTFPEINDFYNKDYTSTLVYVTADVGSGQEKIEELLEQIRGSLQEITTPPGIEKLIAGNPPLQTAMLDVLAQDAVKTIILASLLILLLLFVMEKSVLKGLLIFTPLILGLFWTLGTMGFIGMKLSIATVGIGAMILGLGVEYGVFMLHRYQEERQKGHNQLKSLEIAVPSVGGAVLGSGTTTIVGFLSLTLAITPMMQHLGISLALGIFFSLFAAVFISPSILVLEERFEKWFVHKQHGKYVKKVGGKQ